MLKVTKSCHDQDCLEIHNPTQKEKEVIKEIIFNQWMSSYEYEVKTMAGAFLQSDHDDYILVEFWKKDFQPFVDLVNQRLSNKTF